MIHTLLYFLIALIALVIIHELGHFLMARALGVKVLRFSVGFGKILTKFKDKKNTEYVLSLIPLGGYVKMLDETEGEVHPEEKKFAFNNKPLWAKFLIVVAGPLFNLLLAILIFWILGMVGTYTLAPIIAEVKPNSIAASAGLKPQDEIIKLNQTPIHGWQSFYLSIMPFIGSQSNFEMTVQTPSHQYRTVTLQGIEWAIDKGNFDPLEAYGIIPFIPKIPPIIGGVVKNSPAAQSNLKMGDQILKFDGKVCDDWLDLVDYVTAHPNKMIILTLKRQNETFDVSVKSGGKKVNNKIQGFIGLYSKKMDWPPSLIRLDKESPLAALGTSLKQTYQLSTATVSIMGRLLIGELPLKILSGPVGVAQGAGESAKNGWNAYFNFIALISISLGVLNLMPIPLLDGGYLFFYLIEGVLRVSIPEKIKVISMYFGLIILIGIMLIAFNNDITRLSTS